MKIVIDVPDEDDGAVLLHVIRSSIAFSNVDAKVTVSEQKPSPSPLVVKLQRELHEVFMSKTNETMIISPNLVEDAMTISNIHVNKSFGPQTTRQKGKNRRWPTKL